MSLKITTTAKSTIYIFDGYSEEFRAFIQGAFTGKFIVPKRHARLPDDRYTLNTLRGMHANRHNGIVCRNVGRVN